MIKNFILEDADEYDFVICEIGGSAGDYEAEPFLETVRLMQKEYYVLGDDYCPKCIDSRKYGPITKKQIIGKVL